jgi:hypothetical protein
MPKVVQSLYGLCRRLARWNPAMAKKTRDRRGLRAIASAHEMLQSVPLRASRKFASGTENRRELVEIRSRSGTFGRRPRPGAPRHPFVCALRRKALSIGANSEPGCSQRRHLAGVDWPGSCIRSYFVLGCAVALPRWPHLPMPAAAQVAAPSPQHGTHRHEQ